jgi:hypothetical protein
MALAWHTLASLLTILLWLSIAQCASSNICTIDTWRLDKGNLLSFIYSSGAIYGFILVLLLRNPFARANASYNICAFFSITAIYFGILTSLIPKIKDAVECKDSEILKIVTCAFLLIFRYFSVIHTMYLFLLFPKKLYQNHGSGASLANKLPSIIQHVIFIGIYIRSIDLVYHGDKKSDFLHIASSMIPLEFAIMSHEFFSSLVIFMLQAAGPDINMLLLIFQIANTASILLALNGYDFIEKLGMFSLLNFEHVSIVCVFSQTIFGSFDLIRMCFQLNALGSELTILISLVSLISFIILMLWKNIYMIMPVLLSMILSPILSYDDKPDIMKILDTISPVE